MENQGNFQGNSGDQYDQVDQIDSWSEDDLPPLVDSDELMDEDDEGSDEGSEEGSTESEESGQIESGGGNIAHQFQQLLSQGLQQLGINANIIPGDSDSAYIGGLNSGDIQQIQNLMNSLAQQNENLQDIDISVNPYVPQQQYNYDELADSIDSAESDSPDESAELDESDEQVSGIVPLDSSFRRGGTISSLRGRFRIGGMRTGGSRRDVVGRAVVGRAVTDYSDSGETFDELDDELDDELIDEPNDNSDDEYMDDSIFSTKKSAKPKSGKKVAKRAQFYDKTYQGINKPLSQMRKTKTISSSIGGSFSMRGIYLYGNFMSVENNFNIEDYNNGIWCIDGDFGENYNISEDERMIVSAELTSLYEQIPFIISYEAIDKEELDDNFENFLKNAPNGIQYVMNMMFDNYNYTFDPLQKFTWIYLCTASRFETRAIKYIVNGPYYNPEILDKKDAYGYSPLAVACRSISPDAITELCKTGDVTTEMFSKPSIKGIPMIMLAMYNIDIFKYVIENVPNVLPLLDQTYEVSDGVSLSTMQITPFMFACSYYPDIATFMLENGLISKDHFEHATETSITCLMIVAMHQPNLLFQLLDHDFCSQDLVDTINSTYGSILNIIIKYHVDKLEQLLNHKFMSKKVFDGTMNFGGSVRVTNLFQTCNNIEAFEKICNSPYCDEEIVNKKVVGANGGSETNILFELLNIATSNIQSLEIFLNSSCDKGDIFKTLGIDGHDCLTVAIHQGMDGEIFKMLYEHLLKNDKLTLEELLVNGGNLHFYTLIRKHMELMSYEFLDDYLIPSMLIKENVCGEMDNLNLLVHICRIVPKLGLRLLKKYEQDLKMLLLVPTGQYKKPTFHYIFGLSNNEELLNYLFNSEVMDDIIDLENIEGNNIVLEVAKYNTKMLRILVSSDKFKDVHLAQENKDGDSLLHFLIKNKNFEIMKTLLDSGKIGESSIHKKDRNGYNPFLSACRVDPQIAQLIMESECFDDDVFYATSKFGENCLHLVSRLSETVSGYNFVIYLLTHPLTTSEFLKSKDKNGKNLVQLSLEYGFHKFLINHQLVDEEFLLDGCKSFVEECGWGIDEMETVIDSGKCSKQLLMLQHDTMLLTIMKAKNVTDNIKDRLVKKIFELPCFDVEVLLQPDESGCSSLLFLTPGITKMLIESEFIERSIIDQKVVKDLNLIQFYATLTLGSSSKMVQNAEQIAEILIKSKYSTLDDLTYVSETGSCLITNFFKPWMLDLPYITEESLESVDKMGRTLLHNIAINDELDIILEILYSDICSERLVNMEDNNGLNFIPMLEGGDISCKELKMLLDCPLISSKTLESSSIINKTNLLTSLIINYKPILYEDEDEDDDETQLEIMLNHPKMSTGQFLIEGNRSNLLYALEVDNGSYELLLNCSSCNDQVVNYVIDMGEYEKMTVLLYLILLGKMDKLINLLDSKHNLAPSFGVLDSMQRNPLMNAVYVSYEIFITLAESKYFNPMMYDHVDDYGHNVAIYAISSSLDITKYLAESQYWDKMKYHQDIDNDFILLFSYRNPEITKYLLESDKVDDKMICMTNRMGMNLSHMYCLKGEEKYGTESMQLLLESGRYTEELFLSQDVIGCTPLHTACEHSAKSAELLIKSEFMSNKVMVVKANSGLNVAMLSVKFNNAITDLLFDLGYLTNVVLAQKDTSLVTTMMYIGRYSPKLLEKVLGSEHFEKHMLYQRDKKNRTLLMYCCRYNAASVKYLVEHGIDNSMMFNGHMDYGSALITAARYQPLALKYMLQYQNINYKVLNANEKGMNFINTGCRYNADSVKYAIESNYDLEHFFSGLTKVLIYACRYQPDAVSHILESKYASAKMLKTIKDGRTCIEEAYDFQPKALVHLIKSEYGDDKNLNREDEIGYRLMNKIRSNYPNIRKLEDVTKINLTDYTNDIAEEDDPMICEICCNYKTKIVFNPCCHTSCVGCAFKMRKCHICRKMIEDKKPIYS